MDRYVKNFIIMSIIYLTLASLLGVAMIAHPNLLTLKFVHSHLMVLGWVSMMIYGVGYHILPRFAGRLIKNKGLCEAQFWLANIGLIGLVTFYALETYYPEVKAYGLLTALSGLLEVLSIVLFLYNMSTVLLSRSES